MNNDYKPSFTWRKSKAGDDCIHDGDTMVAAFYPGAECLPRSESAPLRPVSLHNLRLVPGGPVMIADGELCGPLCLSWVKQWIFLMKVEELRADDSDPEKFKLYVRTRDVALRGDRPGQDEYKPGTFKEQTWLELTYDNKLESYVYDLRTSLSLVNGSVEFVMTHDYGGLDFGDILPAGAFDLFPPRGNKKYTYIIYKASDGQIFNRPQNKQLGPDKFDLIYAPDGFAAFVAEPCGNPVVEFLDGSGSMVKSAICYAMYDLHLTTKRDIQCELLRAGKPVEVHYRFYSMPYERARALLEQSKPDPILEHPLIRCPVYNEHGVNTFAPSDEYRSPSDKWFWRSTGLDCVWDWEEGYKTKGSLMIQRESARQNPSLTNEPWARTFKAQADGSDCSQWFYTLRPPIARVCQVKAMIRTADVEGRAFLGYQYLLLSSDGMPRYSDLIVSDEELSGTNDWTEIALETEAPADDEIALAYAFFALEGKGKCWLDELEIIEK